MSDGLEEKGGVLWWRDVAFVPSIHGKAAFAREVRRVFLSSRFPTVAVEIPESLAEKTLEGIAHLPKISVVTYEESSGTHVYYPIDPCDSIVEALRLGCVEAGTSLEFIDRDVEEFERIEVNLPDPYAMTSIGLARYYRAVEPALPAAAPGSQDDLRERHMADRIWKLLERGRRALPVLCVIGLGHLRGIAARLDALARGTEEPDPELPPPPPLNVSLRRMTEGSLHHVLGELPWTTHLWELERRAITLDEFDAVDKMKELLVEARNRYHEGHNEDHERIPLASFQNLLQLVRNLCLIHKRLTPGLYELALAAKGIVGDELAARVIETARRYPFQSGPGAPPPAEGPREEPWSSLPSAKMTEGAIRVGSSYEAAKKRYVDEAKIWKKLRLEAPPPPKSKEKWLKAWVPHQCCSWTPEDILIENFAGHVRARALTECGIGQERLEEFRTSFKDGIHVRETLRNLHLGKIIVKETPVVRGRVGAVVIIYERPEGDRFPWKLTWLPEYEWESALAFYASDYTKDIVGPGIARAVYGGQLFLRSRHPIRDIWTDPELSEAETDDERLLLAAAQRSDERFIAYVARTPPSARLKALASRAGKRIVYMPLSSFSRTTIEKLRRFHVLNGKPVRNYAARYIR